MIMNKKDRIDKMIGLGSSVEREIVPQTSAKKTEKLPSLTVRNSM